MQHTIDWEARRRCSAVDAFLRPVLSNPKLTIVADTVATRIRIENGRATGVEVKGPSGAETFHADSEVIVAAGTYMTPKLMMLSGIGPAGELSQHGIADPGRSAGRRAQPAGSSRSADRREHDRGFRLFRPGSRLRHAGPRPAIHAVQVGRRHHDRRGGLRLHRSRWKRSGRRCSSIACRRSISTAMSPASSRPMA